MLQRLLIAFAQVKSGNKSEKLLNEIRQTHVLSYRRHGSVEYSAGSSFYQAKEITKKVYNMNSIKV